MCMHVCVYVERERQTDREHKHMLLSWEASTSQSESKLTPRVAELGAENSGRAEASNTELPLPGSR